MHKKTSYEKRYKTWHAKADQPRALNPDDLEVRGLQQNNLIEPDMEGQTACIKSEIDTDNNTRERARSLRVLTVKVLNHVFEVEGERLEDAELVVSELVQNAFRYSVSGPIWVSIVQILAKRGNTSVRIVDITVANRINAKEYDYVQDTGVADDNDADGLSVHGRGSIILDTLTWRHDMFEDQRSRTLGAYALINMGQDEDGDLLATVA
jgi:anti-sigma regulatory factor (Ser/Thr protein kinase)